MSRQKITRRQLGFLLFSSSMLEAKRKTEDVKYLKSFGLDKKEKTHLIKEFFAIILLEVFLALQDKVSQAALFQIMDEIYACFYSKLKEREIDQKQIGNEISSILRRHEEYSQIINEKDANWTLYLGQKMFNNLMQNETQNFENSIILSTTFFKNINTRKEFIDKFEVEHEECTRTEYWAAKEFKMPTCDHFLHFTLSFCILHFAFFI